MRRTSVLPADNQLFVKEAWRILFNNFDSFMLAGEAATTDDTLMQVENLKPDIVMFEINMPGTNPFEIIDKISKGYPSVKILIFSAIKDIKSVLNAFRNGAHGYVTKDSTVEEVHKALNLISAGHKYVCDELNEHLINQVTKNPLGSGEEELWDKLTPSEKKVIYFLQKGVNSKTIAEQLKISTRTVEVHRYHILKKFEMPSTAALIAYINRVSK
ncbi:MAG: response regulator transcription factor [Sphingobacteriales bacterium]|nr:response regulator transcription factor [Sphingobacteriales bacterium]